MSFSGHPSPPIFKRGPSSHVRFLVLVVICLGLLVADLHYRYLEVVRQTVSVALYPLQRSAAAPAEFVRNATVYFATLLEVQFENAELRRPQVEAAQRLLRFEYLERENTELRFLLDVSRSLETRSVAAEVLYDAPDPFVRKVILDKGVRHGIHEGLAVVDARGMIGQVTRVYPVQAEVTLITDKHHSVPVEVERTGLRGVLTGNGRDPLELRFIPAEADVQVGDRLVTSGLDGLFLPGLPVARVTAVRVGNELFARILGEPIARAERAAQVLALGAVNPAPPRPQADEAITGTHPDDDGASEDAAAPAPSEAASEVPPPDEPEPEEP